MFRVAIPHSRNGALQKLATMNSFRGLPIRFISSAASASQLAPQSTELLVANTRITALAWKRPSGIVLFSTSHKHAITAEGRDKELEKKLQSEKLERNPDGVRRGLQGNTYLVVICLMVCRSPQQAQSVR